MEGSYSWGFTVSGLERVHCACKINDIDGSFLIVNFCINLLFTGILLRQHVLHESVSEDSHAFLQQ